MRFSFTQLDPDSPNRRFNFNVIVDQANVYHGANGRVWCVVCDVVAVEDVAPAVPGLETLVAQLNKSNDFAGFIKQMRAAFKALCC